VGDNSIEKMESNCVLREHWASSDGKFSGTSMNFFNPKTGQWEQLWVDSSGNHLKLEGNRTKNQMILTSSDFVHTDGHTYKKKK